MPSELRSRTMRAVKGRDTNPEMVVRRLLHRMGYRYRLHRKDLPSNSNWDLCSIVTGTQIRFDYGYLLLSPSLQQAL